MNPNFDEIKDFLESKFQNRKASTAIILGSGLGFFASERIQDPIKIPYESIPGFPISTVDGHEGQFVLGKIQNKTVLCMQGRFHFYEGYNMEQVTIGIRILSLLGIKQVIVTNASGGINKDYEPGDFMLLSDHINFMGSNPLIGQNKDRFGTRFPDMSEVYSKELRSIAKDCNQDEKIKLHEGVYIAVTGPSFETPAEILAFKTLGADVVGMSTVPEAIVAKHCGMKVCGISCVTNKAAGISKSPLSHHEVNETANRVKKPFANFIEKFLEKIA